LWVLGDEVEQSLPVDLEFAPWHEEELIGEYRSHIDEYHGWTDGSRRVSAAFWWSHRGYNDQGKEVESDCNTGSLGEFETAFDGEMEAIADVMEYAIDNQIPGHSGIVGNERADQLAGEAASEKRHGRTSIAWPKERISQHFTIAKDSETDKGKETITPPAPKKSFLDRASNRLARTVAQIRAGHWLCAPYLKRVRKNREEQVSDKCWWCGQYRMSRTHVFLRCTQRFLGPPRRRSQDKKMSSFCRPALREIKVGIAISRLDNGNRCWFGWSG
jgi:hypothetical protein